VMIRTRAPLGDALPFWFAMMNPLIGLAAGLCLAWLFTRL